MNRQGNGSVSISTQTASEIIDDGASILPSPFPLCSHPELFYCEALGSFWMHSALKIYLRKPIRSGVAFRWGPLT